MLFLLQLHQQDNHHHHQLHSYQRWSLKLLLFFERGSRNCNYVAAHLLRNFLLMVAMHDYYYYILTGASPLQQKDKVRAKAQLTNFIAKLKEISGRLLNFVALFWSCVVSGSSTILCLLAKPILECKTTGSFPFQLYFMIYSQFFLFIRY